MKQAFELEPSFILHRRRYRDSSLLIDFFSKRYGIGTAIAKGACRPKSSLRAVLHPFTPLLLTCHGKSELLGLYQAETAGKPCFLSGNLLIAGLYLNELILKLLAKHDPHPLIFELYQRTLIKLINHDNLEATLRSFEMQLLVELGYGLQLIKTENGETIQTQFFYEYHIEKGFKKIDQTPTEQDKQKYFFGEHLYAISAQTFVVSDVQQTAKRLFRTAFKNILSEKRINSRDLYLVE